MSLEPRASQKSVEFTTLASERKQESGHSFPSRPILRGEGPGLAPFACFEAQESPGDGRNTLFMRELRVAPARGRAGVSLLSMLLALACMAIVAGFAIPAFFGLHGVTLDNAARLLARDLRVAQNMAGFDGQPCTFEFLDEGRGWRVIGADGNVLTRPDQKGPFERDFTVDGVFEGVRLQHIDFDGHHWLRFDKAGRALPGGTLQVTFDGEMRVLRVVALSGRVILNGLAEEYYDSH